MTKKILSFSMALILLFALAGCGAKDGDLEKFTIILDWYPNAVHGFLYQAIEKGYYAEEGLEVEILFPANVSDPLAMTAVGKADMGIYYLRNTILARANEGVPIKAVGSLLQGPASVVISLKESNILTGKDLIGKKIGGISDPLGEKMVQTIIETAGGTMQDVTFVNVGFDLMTALTTGAVDATFGNMIHHEVPTFEEKGIDINYMFSHECGTPYDPEMIFVAGDKLIEENPEKINRFLRASQKGFEDMQSDPEGTIDLLIEKQNADNFPLSRGVETKSIALLLPNMETEEADFLYQDKTLWQNNLDWLTENGLLTGDISVDDLVYIPDLTGE